MEKQHCSPQNISTIKHLLFLHLAVPLGSVHGTLGYRGTPVGNHWSRCYPCGRRGAHWTFI